MPHPVAIPRRAAVLRRLTGLLLAAACLGGCSSLRTDAAKSLGEAGQQTAEAIAATAVLSDAACQQALDVDTLVFHYNYGGMEVQPALAEQRARLTEDYVQIHNELRARRKVFAELAAAYQAFSDLADNQAAVETAEAVEKLSDAVSKYAEATGGSPIFSGSTQRNLGKLGWLATAEMKKKRLKEASALLRSRLTAFAKLLQNPLVKEQQLGFQEHLAGIKGEGIQLLWEAGAFDPSPLLDELGADIGLRASPEADTLSLKDKKFSSGLGAVVVSRLRRKINLVREGYEASVNAVDELAREHKKLEQDGSLDLDRLRNIAAEQQRAAQPMTPAKEESK